MLGMNSEVAIGTTPSEGRRVSAQEIRRALIADGVDPFTADSFIVWLREHGAIWQAFEREARKAGLARRKTGSKAIVELLRRDPSVARGPGEFKICNSYVSYLGRVFALKWPEYRAVLQFKQVRGLRKQ